MQKSGKVSNKHNLHNKISRFKLDILYYSKGEPHGQN
jgi:hypothetical protein